MDYFSQKIKSLPRLKARPDLHCSVMNRVFYLKMRWPMIFLAILAGIKLGIDSWHIFNHSVREVVGGLTENFDWSMVSISDAGAGIMGKALLHPDLMADLLIDTILIGYILYVISLLKQTRAHEANNRRNEALEFVYALIRNSSKVVRAAKEFAASPFSKKVG